MFPWAFHIRVFNIPLRYSYGQILHTDNMNCTGNRLHLLFTLSARTAVVTCYMLHVTSQKTNKYGILAIVKTLHTAVHVNP